MPSMRARSWNRSIALGARWRWARTSYQLRGIPVVGSISFSMAAVIDEWAREMPSQSSTALVLDSLATAVIPFIDSHIYKALREPVQSPPYSAAFKGLLP